MMKSKDSRLIALCSAIYFTSYLTRKAYEASILAICDDTGLARTAAGLAGTATVAFYGGGQFFTGWLADRIDPRKIVLVALLLTSACNAALPAATGNVAALVAVNALNGFAQAMFWPPLVKIFASTLTAERYKCAVFAVNVAANAAIVAIFALVAGCIHFAGWRLSFRVVAATALAMAAVWRVCGTRLQSTAPACVRLQPTSTGDARQRPATLAAAMLLPAVLAIVCMGVIRDGIEAWAPSIVTDVFGLGTSGSTLSVALLPAFAVASMSAARRLRAVLGDEIRVALVLFALGLVCATTLLATGGGSVAVGLPLLAILSAAMHGANLMLVCELPGRFARSGWVGTISGILNSGVYVGAALSIYGFAALRDHYAGWHPVFAIWAGIIAVGMALLAVSLCRMRRRKDDIAEAH